jgi:hypothetical protein
MYAAELLEQLGKQVFSSVESATRSAHVAFATRSAQACDTRKTDALASHSVRLPFDVSPQVVTSSVQNCCASIATRFVLLLFDDEQATVKAETDATTAKNEIALVSGANHEFLNPR